LGLASVDTHATMLVRGTNRHIFASHNWKSGQPRPRFVPRRKEAGLFLFQIGDLNEHPNHVGNLG